MDTIRFLNPNSHLVFHFLVLLFLLSSPLATKVCLGLETPSKSNFSKCVDMEREALLAFKKGLTDPSGRLSSWEGEDCCKWNGIQCNNQTGHVTKLDLSNPYQLINGGIGDPTAYKKSCLGGKINASSLYLQHLTYLDMSFNDFEGIPIPDFFGGFRKLRYLNLSFSSFGGDIPPQLGNLSGLLYLDLYSDSYSSTSSHELSSGDLNWLHGLSSLKYLNLGYVKLDRLGADWFKAVNMLPSLAELNLQFCQLQVLPQLLPFINFTSLSVLELSDNSFNSFIPHWVFNLTSLTRLYLRWNFLSGAIPSEFVRLKSLQVLDLSANLNLGGQIPSFFGSLKTLQVLDLSADNLSGEIQEFLGGFSGNTNNSLVSLYLSSNSLTGELPNSLGLLKSLQRLDLSGNSFWGSIPTSIGKLSFLKELDLSYNNMNGSIPESLGQLSELVEVNLMANSWEGILKEAHLMSLHSLQGIRLTTEPSSSLVFNVSSKWIPPFRLQYIHLENCLVGPVFPEWLRLQGELTSVTLRNVGMSDTIPGEWFSKLSPQLTYLVLSNNQIKGKLPNRLESPNLSVIDLSLNNFEGPLPLWSTNATTLYLHDNSFSGSLPENIGKLMPRMEKLYLSGNHLNGRIPSSLCELVDLQILSLRSNHLSGELPNCWHQSNMLWAIDVSRNNITGQIPSSFGLLPSLSVLLLSHNLLCGEIPTSMQNCSGLTSLDLGWNRFSGSLPSWTGGEKFASLFMLRLTSNSFGGPLPPQLWNSPNLHILDLSHNKFSGRIPLGIQNLTALVYGNSSEVFEQLLIIAIKGRSLDEYRSIIANVNSIDLSGNNLMGGIPDDITLLSMLRNLKLAENHLSGKITENIGDLQQLETLDLSGNHLSGSIPQSLASLNSLLHLNLSYNNLQGRIPEGLQKFKDPSIFIGNPSLCGDPLPTKCPQATDPFNPSFGGTA